MLKKLSALAIIGFTAFSANSATYQVNVVLNVERSPLQITQSQSMVFNELLVNEASRNGYVCNATDSEPANSLSKNLCSGAWSGKSARFTVSGTPRAAISYTFTGEDQIKDGLRFFVPGSGTTRTVALDTNGEVTVSSSGAIELVDKDIAINAPGTKTFSYDFVAAYQ